MNEFLRKFDTIKFVASWNFFRNFLRIFHFFEFKFKIWIWTGWEPVGTGTGPDRFDRLPVKPDRFPPVRWTLPPLESRGFVCFERDYILSWALIGPFCRYSQQQPFCKLLGPPLLLLKFICPCHLSLCIAFLTPINQLIIWTKFSQLKIFNFRLWVSNPN